MGQTFLPLALPAPFAPSLWGQESLGHRALHVETRAQQLHGSDRGHGGLAPVPSGETVTQGGPSPSCTMGVEEGRL